MLKDYITITLLICLITITFANMAKANEVTFDNTNFVLKATAQSLNLNDSLNEYFPSNENRDNWTRMLGVYHHPTESNPIKYAEDFDKEIEAKESCVLLKFAANKKANQAVISFLENGSENGRDFFTYNVFKYEKNPTKGMTEFKYAVKYFFKDDTEITSIGKRVREDNDKYMTLLISSAIPPIVEKELDLAK